MSGNGTRPWVAYVGPFPYPEGAAASRRVLGMAESLSLAGFDVVVASGAGTETDDDGCVNRQGDGISWCKLAERVAEHWPRPLRRFRYAWMGGRTVEWLAAQPVPPVAVILYSGYTPYLQRLLPWCKRNGVRLLFDAVEWYEPEHPWGYLTSPYQWNIEWAMRHLVPKTDGVIAISHYLANYYRQRGLPVVVVPPTTSAIAAGNWQPSSGLRLCYAGTPGANKDELGAIVQAVSRLVADGAPIELTIAGPARAQVLALMGHHAGRCTTWLNTPGVLAFSDVQRLIGGADFSILARRPSRVTRAGFSTKYVESLACGTPVIANLTGDLHEHLRDGETGLICGSHCTNSIKRGLERALLLDAQVLGAMRNACSAYAHHVFSPANYVKDVRGLVQVHA